MVLVNGAEGIGTGWSTSVPNYNPADLVKNLKHLLRDEPREPMHPWFRGFKVLSTMLHATQIEFREQLNKIQRRMEPTKFLVFGPNKTKTPSKSLSFLLALGLQTTKKCLKDS